MQKIFLFGLLALCSAVSATTIPAPDPASVIEVRTEHINGNTYLHGADEDPHASLHPNAPNGLAARNVDKRGFLPWFTNCKIGAGQCAGDNGCYICDCDTAYCMNPQKGECLCWNRN